MNTFAAFVIRRAVQHDFLFLCDMLWEAAAADAGMCEMGKEAALTHPNNQKYLQDWGRPGDCGVIAGDAEGQPLGAAWYRFFPADAHGYGFAAADIPELSIGVNESARGQRVGSALLGALCQLGMNEGLRAISLSVDRRNPAIALYERHGFRDAGLVGPDKTSITMVTRFE